MTDASALDVVGSINDDVVYEDSFESAEELEVTGADVRVLSLERLIQLKRALGLTPSFEAGERSSAEFVASVSGVL